MPFDGHGGGGGAAIVVGAGAGVGLVDVPIARPVAMDVGGLGVAEAPLGEGGGLEAIGPVVPENGVGEFEDAVEGGGRIGGGGGGFGVGAGGEGLADVGPPARGDEVDALELV